MLPTPSYFKKSDKKAGKSDRDRLRHDLEVLAECFNAVQGANHVSSEVAIRLDKIKFQVLDIVMEMGKNV